MSKQFQQRKVNKGESDRKTADGRFGGWGKSLKKEGMGSLLVDITWSWKSREKSFLTSSSYFTLSLSCIYGLYFTSIVFIFILSFCHFVCIAECLFFFHVSFLWLFLYFSCAVSFQSPLELRIISSICAGMFYGLSCANRLCILTANSVGYSNSMPNINCLCSSIFNKVFVCPQEGFSHIL